MSVLCFAKDRRIGHCQKSNNLQNTYSFIEVGIDIAKRNLELRVRLPHLARESNKHKSKGKTMKKLTLFSLIVSTLVSTQAMALSDKKRAEAEAAADQIQVRCHVTSVQHNGGDRTGNVLISENQLVDIIPRIDRNTGIPSIKFKTIGLGNLLPGIKAKYIEQNGTTISFSGSKGFPFFGDSSNGTAVIDTATRSGYYEIYVVDTDMGNSSVRFEFAGCQPLTPKMIFESEL